jgi:hypothetical protein
MLLHLRRDLERRPEQARRAVAATCFIGGHDHMLGLDAEGGCSMRCPCWYGSRPRHAGAGMAHVVAVVRLHRHHVFVLGAVKT